MASPGEGRKTDDQHRRGSDKYYALSVAQKGIPDKRKWANSTP